MYMKLCLYSIKVHVHNMFTYIVFNLQNVKKPTAQPKTIKSMFLMGSKSTKSDQVLHCIFVSGKERLRLFFRNSITKGVLMSDKISCDLHEMRT